MIQNTTIFNAFLWDLKMAQTFCTLSDRWPSLPSTKYPPPGNQAIEKSHFSYELVSKVDI